MKKISDGKFYIQSIHRAFTIIEVISKSDSGLTLTTIAEKTKLPISTVYRIIQNLVTWQYVKEDENGVYTLGFELITLGNISNNNMVLKEVAQKYMGAISEITKETIYLAILDDTKGEVMYIDKIESKKNIKLAAGIGSRNYIHTTANGKVLISQFDDMKIKDLLKIIGMPKLTETSITQVDDFLTEVKKVRQLGYAIDDLENEPQVRCIAAPILDYRNKIVGSISISGISSNITHEIINNQYKDLVIETALKISSELGYRK